MRTLLIALALCCLGQTRTEIHSYRGARVRMAATTHTWTNGTADGSWATVGNWDTGQLPGTGGAGLDTVIFDGSVTQTGPSADMDRNADAALFRIIVMKNFTGDIGGVGNPLIHEVDGTSDPKARFIHAGTGTVYFEAEGVNDYAHVGNGTSYLDCTATPGTLRNVFVTRGYVNLAATAKIGTRLVIDGPGAEVVSVAESGAGTTPLFTVITSGTYANAKTQHINKYVIVFGGAITQTGRINDFDYIFIGPQGRMEYMPALALGAAHDNIVMVCAGLFDTSKTNQAVSTEALILLQLANVRGTPLSQGDMPKVNIDIDLREEYP